jgi:predicted dehydrogenase
MFRNLLVILTSIALVLTVISCNSQKDSTMNFTGAKGEVKIMTIDPGHFHAALVQKNMYDQVDPVVHIYAPDGPDVADHLNRITGFNTRAEAPTTWDLKLYKGDDFLDKMISEKPGNVMITSGNNKKKTQYIKAAVDAGINVLADKPMAITKDNFELLKQAFESAKANNVLLYDIMTERHEITTMLQKEVSLIGSVFGELEKGTADNPAVTKESVHHFFKYVAGNPIKRPPWYFDVTQQGEGMVDVNTHLVDLVQWECFPGQIINYETDIEMVDANHWPTLVKKEEFEKVTRLPEIPDYLQDKINKDGVLEIFCNGDMTYKLKGVFAKVSVIWNYQAPEGTGDTHFSIMRGTKANAIIRQGKEQSYKPELYIETPKGGNARTLAAALETEFPKLVQKYPGIELKKEGKIWHVVIPKKYHDGHEAHFGQVAEKYLQYLIDGKLPDWEVPNMIAKYYTNVQALEMALSK